MEEPKLSNGVSPEANSLGGRVRELAYSHEGTKKIADAHQCGWFDGGCAILAHGIAAVTPGAKLYSVFSHGRPHADHVVVAAGNNFIDGDGAHTHEQLLSAMRDREGLVNPQLHPYSDTHLHHDTPRNPELEFWVAQKLSGGTNIEKSEMEQWLQLRKSSLKKNDETKVASVAVFNADGKMLFGRRADSGKWTLPGGHFEVGESPEEAGLRELLEETGLTPDEDGFGYLGEGLAGDTLRIYCFKCFVSGEPTAEADPDKEMSEFKWVSISNGLPHEVSSNLHAPKNITLRLLGLQEGELKKAEFEEKDRDFLNAPNVNHTESDSKVRLVSSIAKLPPDLHEHLALHHPDIHVRNAAIYRPDTPPHILTAAVKNPEIGFHSSNTLSHPNLPPEAMLHAIESPKWYPNRYNIYRRDDVPKEVVKRGLDLGHHSTIEFNSPTFDNELVNHAVFSANAGARQSVARMCPHRLNSDQKIKLLTDEDEDVRTAMARYGKLTPEEQARALPLMGTSAIDTFLRNHSRDISHEAMYQNALSHPDKAARELFGKKLVYSSHFEDGEAAVHDKWMSQLASNSPDEEVVKAALGSGPASSFDQHMAGGQLPEHVAVAISLNPRSTPEQLHAAIERSTAGHIVAAQIACRVAEHRKTSPDTLGLLLNHPQAGYNAAGNPRAPVDALRALADNPNTPVGTKEKANKTLSIHEPDRGFKESVGFALDVAKLRKLRDLVDGHTKPKNLPDVGSKITLPDGNKVEVVRHSSTVDGHFVFRDHEGREDLMSGDAWRATSPASAPKQVHKNTYKHLGLDLTPFTKPNTPFIDSSKVQAAIDAAPKLRYNISHDKQGWDGVQRHNAEHSRVFQLNLTNEIIGKLKDAGVYDTFTKMHEASVQSAHPVHQTHGLGWVRYTQGSDPLGEAKCEFCNGDGYTDPYDDEQDCYHCDGSGEDPDPSDVHCDDCEGTGETPNEDDPDTSGKCTSCNGHGEKAPDEPGNCPICDGSGRETVEVESQRCDECNGKGKVKKSPIRSIHPDRDHFFIDEVQSDFGQQFGKQILANTRNELVRVGRNRGLAGDALKSYVNEHLSGAIEDVNRDYPEEHTKAVNQILFGGRHSNEILYEAFLQHIRDKGHVGSEVRGHSVESKGPISLGDSDRTKWIDPSNRNARVDLDDQQKPFAPENAQAEEWKAKGYLQVPDIPGHFRETYERIPLKVLGWDEHRYGEGPGETGAEEGDHDGGGDWGHLENAKIYGDKLRRHLEENDQPAIESIAREVVMPAGVQEVSFQKSLREKFTALAGAAAMASAPMVAHAPSAAHALSPPPAPAAAQAAPETLQSLPPSPPIESAPWHAEGLATELKPIAHLESNYGKNMVHTAHSKGEFHTAWGACGLKPVTAAEEYQKQPHLKAMFPGLDDPAAFTQALKTNHTFYNLVASAHWARLKRVMGTPEKAAYAWRWGRGAATLADENAIKADPYVQAYGKLFAKVAGSPATKSIMAKGFDTYAKEWLSKAGPTVTFDHYSRQPDLSVLDPKFQGTGATGAEKQRPQRPPRVYLYQGGTEPEPQVAAGGFKYRAELPASIKLYDFSKDEHKLMKPRVTKTPRGTMIDPPDLDAIERKLIKLGFHGYKGYSPNAPNAVAIFRKVKVTPVEA